MPGSTPIYSWAYQSLADPPDGPDLGKTLAEDIEATVDGIDDRVALLEPQARIITLGTTEPQNNTTALSGDMGVALPSAGNFAFDGVLYYRSTAAAGLKLTFAGSGGVANAVIRFGVEGNASMAFGGTTLGITVPGTGFYKVAFQGVATNTGGSAGSITLQYAQTTANAGPTGPLSGRWMRAMRIT